MFAMGRFRFMLWSGGVGEERLDQPLSNYDVIGIPTHQWSSCFFACYENIIPSCMVAFCCPCILWGQVIVRSQIPLLIGIKNSFLCLRNQTGYGFFVDVFFWSIILMLILFLIPSVVGGMPSIIRYFMYIVGIGLLIGFLYLNGHLRTAFREK